MRIAFRRAVFARDGYRCRVCRRVSSSERAERELDAHHITDRHEFANGGYVADNGITLCGPCHVLAERYHSTGVAAPGFHPDELYARIGSSRIRAGIADAAVR